MNDNPTIEEVKKMMIDVIDNFYNNPDYKELEGEVQKQFISDKEGIAFLQDPEMWIPAEDPVKLVNITYDEKIFTTVTALELKGRQVMITFVKLILPESMKENIDQGDNLDKMKEIVNSISPDENDFLDFKLNTMFTLDNLLYEGRDYFFVPLNTVYAMMPEFDYDIIIPYVSFKSFVGELEYKEVIR